MQMKRTESNAGTDPRRQQLMEDIRKTKYALDCAYSNFENVVDPDLIDCYIYEVNAAQKRYKYLLEKAKQTNLIVKEFQITPKKLKKLYYSISYLFSKILFSYYIFESFNFLF